MHHTGKYSPYHAPHRKIVTILEIIHREDYNNMTSNISDKCLTIYIHNYNDVQYISIYQKIAILEMHQNLMHRH